MATNAPNPVTGGLTDEERLLQQTVRDFATREVAPGAAKRDEEERYDRALFDRMAELGLTAVPFPEAIGGAGFSYRAWTLVMEEIAYADMALAVSLSVHILSQYPVITWGTDEQKARWLPGMLAGKEMGAFALTEPQAGSDASALKLRAVRSGTASNPVSYALTGTKIWISNSAQASRFLVFASTDPSMGARGITRLPGRARTLPVSRLGALEHKLGIRSDSTGEIIFKDAEVPAENRLGLEGAGLQDRAVGAERRAHLDRRRVRGPGPGGTRRRGQVPD